MWWFLNMVHYHFILISLRAHQLQNWTSISHATAKFGYLSRQSLENFFWGIISRDPSVSKSNQLHVDIFRVFLYYCEVYSLNSSKMIYKFLEVLKSHRLNPKPNGFICNN